MRALISLNQSRGAFEFYGIAEGRSSQINWVESKLVKVKDAKRMKSVVTDSWAGGRRE